LVLTRYTQPEREPQLLIQQLKFQLALQPPPEITNRRHRPRHLK
jgi:hypothetical protein